MKIEIHSGESVTIVFEGTDGEITVKYGLSELTVHADLPDTKGREGVIYNERFGDGEIVKELLDRNS